MADFCAYRGVTDQYEDCEVSYIDNIILGSQEPKNILKWITESSSQKQILLVTTILSCGFWMFSTLELIFFSCKWNLFCVALREVI